MQRHIALLLLAIATPLTSCFTVLPQTCSCTFQHSTRRWSERQENDDRKMSFDEAGAGLIDEEDVKKLKTMGDYDSNPNSSTDEMETIRAAIRSRTAELGIEKSKVSEEFIAQREAAARAAGSARAKNEASESFGGLDLSQIRTTPDATTVDDDLPSMFFEPEEQLSKEERAEADPVSELNVWQQALDELKRTKWPKPFAAFREVIVVLLIVAATCYMILSWDQFLRHVYTDWLHFIPTKEELANFSNRFDGLGLPEGWMNNMDSSDIEKLSDGINSKSVVLPDL